MVMSDSSPIEGVVWPVHGDSVFIQTTNWRIPTALYQDHYGWEYHIVGYRRAADILVEHILRGDASREYFVYPVVFLYRQYLELRMKRIIVEGQALFGEEPAFPATPTLEPLWGQCSEVIRRVWPQNHGSGDRAAIASIIRQLDVADQDAMVFRYPAGNPAMKGGVCRIDIRTLAEVMDTLAGCLDGAAASIWDVLYINREIGA